MILSKENPKMGLNFIYYHVNFIGREYNNKNLDHQEQDEFDLQGQKWEIGARVKIN